MTDPNDKEDPKIVVDDDWKQQVETEKNQQDFVPMDKSAKPEAESSTPDAVTADDQDEAAAGVPPEASLESLITMLFMQAMATLGQIPDPVSGEPKVNKPIAKHYIDTIELLSEKTKGNTTDQESKMLSEVLQNLRPAYVNTKAP